METKKNKTGGTFKNTESFKFTGNWDTKSRELKTKFNRLTDSDLKFEIGKEEELLGRIQTRLNKNREEVIAIIKEGQLAKV